MNRKVLKKVMLIVLLILFAVSTYYSVFATGYSSIDIGTIVDNANEASGAGSSMMKIIKALLTVVQVIASGIAVIMIIVLAIKYMSSAPNEKADIQKSATAYIVGAVVLFSASGIIGIIRRFSEANVNNKK